MCRLVNRNIFLVGPMGAGKSTVGRYLAYQLNMRFFDSDREIELRTGADISWVFDVEGEVGFRYREEKVISELTEKQGIVLATGGGSVKSCLTCNNLIARGFVVYLKTTIDEQLVRTQRDKRRPLLAASSVKSSKDVREILVKLAKERDPLYEKIADVVVSTGMHSVRVVVSRVITLYQEKMCSI